jgi:hypothetical protein
MRRLLNQAANAAVKVKGSIFEIIYRRCVPRLGHNQAIGVIVHPANASNLASINSSKWVRNDDCSGIAKA